MQRSTGISGGEEGGSAGDGIQEPLHATSAYFEHCVEQLMGSDPSHSLESIARSDGGAHVRANSRHLKSTCKNADLQSWHKRDDEDAIFQRVLLRMGEQDGDEARHAPSAKTFRIHEYVLYSMSNLYRGMREFDATRRERMAQGGAPSLGEIFVPCKICTRPEALSSCIFYMYTGIVFDVGARGENVKEPIASMEKSFKNPSFSFDIMELFMLADFFDIPDMSSTLQQAFFSVNSLFYSISSSGSSSAKASRDVALQQEQRVAMMVARCKHLKPQDLCDCLSETYVAGTGGLQCLCDWPTIYPRCMWDSLIRAGMKRSIFWAAHVLPLYATRFALTPRECMRMLISLRLEEWVGESNSLSGGEGAKGKGAATMDMLLETINIAYTDHRNAKGRVFVNAFSVPEMRSIETLYQSHFGISVRGEYARVVGPLLSSVEEAEAFMDLFIAYTHVICCTLQLLCCLRDKKILACVPRALVKELQGLFHANNPSSRYGSYVSDALDDPEHPPPQGTFQAPDWENILCPLQWGGDFGLYNMASTYAFPSAGGTRGNQGQNHGTPATATGAAAAGAPRGAGNKLGPLAQQGLLSVAWSVAKMSLSLQKSEVMRQGGYAKMVEAFMQKICESVSMCCVAKTHALRMVSTSGKRKRGAGGGNANANANGDNNDDDDGSEPSDSD